MDIAEYLTNLTSSVTRWGDALTALIGIALIIVAAVMIAKGFITHGRGQTNWLLYIAMLLVGGFLFGSKLTGVKTIADVGNLTIANAGAGTGGADADAGGGAGGAGGTTTP